MYRDNLISVDLRTNKFSVETGKLDAEPNFKLFFSLLFAARGRKVQLAPDPAGIDFPSGELPESLGPKVQARVGSLQEGTAHPIPTGIYLIFCSF